MDKLARAASVQLVRSSVEDLKGPSLSCPQFVQIRQLINYQIAVNSNLCYH